MGRGEGCNREWKHPRELVGKSGKCQHVVRGPPPTQGTFVGYIRLRVILAWMREDRQWKTGASLTAVEKVSAGFDTRPGVTSISITCPVLTAALCSEHQIPGTASLLQRWSCISCPPVCTTQWYHLSANGIPEHLSTSSQDSKALRRSPKCSVRHWVLRAAAATFARFPNETAILRCCGGAQLWAPLGYLVALGTSWVPGGWGSVGRFQHGGASTSIGCLMQRKI